MNGLGEVDFMYEHSLDLMLSPGCYVVEIEHTDSDVGLPFDFCGKKHYIVATLIVTDNGTKGKTQKNRLTGQALVVTLQNSLETKVFTRTFAGGEWNEWRSLARTGMYDNISTPDELLATVDSLVTENTRAKEVEESVKRSAVDISSLACTTGNENVTITANSMDGEVIHSVELPAATTEKAGVMNAADKNTILSYVKPLVNSVYTRSDYIGFYCDNVTTGSISSANATGNGILIEVREGSDFEIVGDNLKYSYSSVQFYSDFPNISNNIGVGKIVDNKVTVPSGSRYMLVNVNPSNGNITYIKAPISIGWEYLPVDVYNTFKNLSSLYREQEFTVAMDTGSGNNFAFPISLIEEGDIVQCYVQTDLSINTLLLTSLGRTILTLPANKVVSKQIVEEDITGDGFGFFVAKSQATQKGAVHCELRIIKKQRVPFSLSNQILQISSQIENASHEVISLSTEVCKLEECFVHVNNNNYIKDWETGNKLCVRLYVENKEKAVDDGLYIRQFFRKVGSENNCGVNFGTKTSNWALNISPHIGEFEYYETVNATYGKIAIRIDWNAIDWGTSTSKDIGDQTDSNLEDIVFDWNEFTKPFFDYPKLPDNTVGENQLTQDVREKLKTSLPALANYELFSLGDSLSSGGVWQTKVAELTGCAFDQSKNVKAGAMLSVGGTSSYGETFDNVLWRAKNLIEQNYITGEGENAIVVLENVNDGYVAFDENVKSIIPTTPIEGYNDADFGTELLSSIADKAQLNAVLRLNKVVAGKNLRIDTLPTKSGTITLRVGWAGPGYSNYNIYVEPQATDEGTLQFVLDKILEYAYTGITDVLGEDGRSVDFSSGSSSYLPTVEFTDTDNTGMTVTVTDNPNAKGSVARYFIGDSIDEWTDTEKWQQGISYSQGWKSTIEMLQRAYPKLHIFVSMFPLHSVTASEYLLPNGSYDTVAYNSVARMGNMRKMEIELKKIADYYSLPFINVFRECGIGINNMLTYYNASANVHPKNEGYYRFGETVAAQLKRCLA